MSVDLIGGLALFELHLLGGHEEALALARRIDSDELMLTIHADSPCDELVSLAAEHGWPLDDHLPEPIKGQCWLIASGQAESDEHLLQAAEKAGIAIFAPQCADRSNIRLFHDVSLTPEASSTLAPDQQGFVSLVGAGPGDPGLLTLKAVNRLKQADILVHDRLVSDEIVALASPTAKRLYVGKAKSNHSVPQSDINQALVDWAKAGYRVVRLKGGDPFIFGRGGEELELLAREGIAFEVVPGITAALGVAAYSGIPLTHRDYAQSVRFVTGHLKNGTVDLDWSTLAAQGQTLVFYMGLGSLSEITVQLMANGVSADMPIALVEQGTTARQQVHVGTLSTIEHTLENVAIAPPTLIIVGGVVSLYSDLKWFDHDQAHSLGWQHGKHPTP